jgi:hypothetical protein
VSVCEEPTFRLLTPPEIVAPVYGVASSCGSIAAASLT